MKNIQNFGVQELSAKKIEEINGGFEFGTFFGGRAIAKFVFEELGHFWTGFKNGLEATT